MVVGHQMLNSLPPPPPTIVGKRSTGGGGGRKEPEVMEMLERQTNIDNQSVALPEACYVSLHLDPRNGTSTEVTKHQQQEQEQEQLQQQNERQRDYFVLSYAECQIPGGHQRDEQQQEEEEEQEEEDRNNSSYQEIAPTAAD